MKKVLFIQPSLEAVGGIEKVVPTVAGEMANDGFEVSALTFYGGIPKEQIFWIGRYEQAERDTTGLFNKLFKVFERAGRIRKALRETKADCLIVSAQGAILIVLLLKIIGLIKVPVVAYIHEARSDGGQIYRLMTAALYPFANGWIAVSQGISEEIKSIPLVKKEHVVLAYNALPKNHAAFPDEELVARLSKLERPIYIHAGRFEYTKGVDILVDSFIGHSAAHQGTLVMLGSGSLERELQEKVKVKGLENRIVFLGRVDEPRMFMRHSDVYVSCARSEPFGLALVEALSVGLPVVATDVPSGPREILSPNISPDHYPFQAAYGILMEKPSGDSSQDSQEFTAALELLQQSSFQAEKQRQRAGDFSLEAQVSAIKSLLQKLL